MPRREIICPESLRDVFQKYTFSPAVKMGNTIYLSGFTAVDYTNNKLVGEGNIGAQTRQIFQNMQLVYRVAIPILSA